METYVYLGILLVLAGSGQCAPNPTQVNNLKEDSSEENLTSTINDAEIDERGLWREEGVKINDSQSADADERIISVPVSIPPTTTSSTPSPSTTAPSPGPIAVVPLANNVISERQKRTFWPFTSLFGYDYDYAYIPPPMFGPGPGFYHRPGFGIPPPPPSFGMGFGFGF